MTKIKSPDRNFIYISPLKNCKNGIAQQIASLVEQFLIRNIEIQIDFAHTKVKQIYNHADEYMKGKD